MPRWRALLPASTPVRNPQPLEVSLSANVFPIVDYEPPAFGGPPRLPPVTPRALRPRPICTTPPPVDDTPARIAAAFADGALRRVLEVIDRRRPPAQLRPLLADGLAESLQALAGCRNPRSARLRRVRAQPVGPDGSAAEVTASYTRGDRLHAIAARVEQVDTPTGRHWRLVALHLG